MATPIPCTNGVYCGTPRQPIEDCTGTPGDEHYDAVRAQCPGMCGACTMAPGSADGTGGDETSSESSMIIGIVVAAILVIAGLAAAYIFLAHQKGRAGEHGAGQAPMYADVGGMFETDADADTSYTDVMAAVKTNAPAPSTRCGSNTAPPATDDAFGLTIVNSAFRQEEEADYAASEGRGRANTSWARPGQQAAIMSMSLAVQIMNRHQVQDCLHEAQVEGGYIVRANTEDDAASQSIALSFYAHGTIIHHKIIRQADGSFTCDGKPSTLPTLRQVFEDATARARQTHRFAAMQPVEPGGRIRTIDLLLDGNTNRVSLHDYVEPVQQNPCYETTTPADYPSMEQDDAR